VLGLDTLKLDGNLFTGDDVGSEVDVTETTTTDLTTNAVFIADAKILGRRKVSILQMRCFFSCECIWCV